MMGNNETSMVTIDVLKLNASVQRLEDGANLQEQRRAVQNTGVIAAASLLFAVSTTSPIMPIQLSQSFNRANVISYYTLQQRKIPGRRISRAEALALCKKIAEDAERERLEFAEWEAQRGIPMEFYS